ncbi:hypothetical protein AB5N19_01488 [Seiridium cardinale]
MTLDPIIIDSRGSLQVVVDEDEFRKHLIVCPGAMARAPDVWEKILCGPWKDSAERGDEDNWMHDSRKVRDKLELEEPFQVAVLSDKYDLASQRAPRLNNSFSHIYMNYRNTGDCEEWLRRNIVGQLVFGFRAFELAPLGKFDYDRTLEELDWRRHLIAEPILYCSTTDESEPPEHDSTFCVRTVIHDEINSIHDHNRAPLDERQEQHLRKQAQKTGVKTGAKTGAETDCDSD